MTTSVRCGLTLLVVAACSSRQAVPGAMNSSSTPAALAAPLVRGTIGDTVRMVVNHVRPEKRDQFERFMRDVLHPAMDKDAVDNPTTAEHIRRARLLVPVKMDADSTYAYIFLVDPVATSVPYSFPKALRRMYPPDEAAERLKMFTESLARPSDSYTLVNSVW